MDPGQNSNSYSVQGWLAKIAEQTEGGGGGAVTSPEVITTPTGVIYRFTQPTKPTQRAPGVPLGIGDRWEKSNDGTDWFWNGTYWLSSMIYRLGSPVSVSGGNQGFSVSTGSFLTRSVLDLAPATVSISYINSLFLTEWVVELRAGAIHSNTNYFVVEPGIMREGAGVLLPFSVDTKAIGGGGRTYQVPLNTTVTQPIDGSANIQRLWLQGFGTAPGFHIMSTINYRMVAA